MSEIYVTCPQCQQAGFTARGLRAHRCRANARRPLTKANWQRAVEAATEQKIQDEIDKANDKAGHNL